MSTPPAASRTGVRPLRTTELMADAERAQENSRALFDRTSAVLDRSRAVLTAVLSVQAALPVGRSVLEELRAEIDGLREAMATRGVIEQAKGVLMATEGCTADEAFELLVKMSQRQHLKLRDVAMAVVARLTPHRD